MCQVHYWNGRHSRISDHNSRRKRSERFSPDFEKKKEKKNTQGKSSVIRFVAPTEILNRQPRRGEEILRVVIEDWLIELYLTEQKEIFCDAVRGSGRMHIRITAAVDIDTELLRFQRGSQSIFERLANKKNLVTRNPERDPFPLLSWLYLLL